MSMNVKKEIEGMFSKISICKDNANAYGYLVIPGSEEINKYIRSLTKLIPGGPLLKFIFSMPTTNVLKIGKESSIYVYSVNTEYHAEDTDKHRMNLIYNVGPSLDAKFIYEDDLKDEFVMNCIKNSRTSDVIIIRFPYNDEDILKIGVSSYVNASRACSLFKKDTGRIQRLTRLNNNFTTMCEDVRNNTKSNTDEPVFYMKGISGFGSKYEDKYTSIIRRMCSEWPGNLLDKPYIGFIPLFKKNEVYLDDFAAKNIDKNIIYDKNNKDVDDIVKGLYVCMNLNRFFDDDGVCSECSKELEESWTDLVSMNEFNVRMLFFNEGSQLFDILCPFIMTFDKFKSFYDDKIKDISELILIGYDISMHNKVKAAENIFNTYRDTYVDAASHYWDDGIELSFSAEIPKKKIEKFEYIDRDDINGINKSKEVTSMNDGKVFRPFAAVWADAVKEIGGKPAGGKLSETPMGNLNLGIHERSLDEISKHIDDQHFRWRYGKTEINPIDIRFSFNEELELVNNEVTIKNAFMGSNSTITFRKAKDSYDTVIDYFDINKIMFAKFKTLQKYFVKHMSGHMFDISVSFVFMLDKDNFVNDIIVRMDNCKWIMREDRKLEMSIKSSNFDKNPFEGIANNIIELYTDNTKDIENTKISAASTMINKLDVSYELDNIFISASDIGLLGMDIIKFPMNVRLVRNKEFEQVLHIEMPLLYVDQESNKLAPCKYTTYNPETYENVYSINLASILGAMDLSRIASVVNMLLGFNKLSIEPTISLSYGPSLIYNAVLYTKRFNYNNHNDLVHCIMETLQMDKIAKEYINAYNVELHKASVSMNVNKSNKLLDDYEI